MGSLPTGDGLPFICACLAAGMGRWWRRLWWCRRWCRRPVTLTATQTIAAILGQHTAGRERSQVGASCLQARVLAAVIAGVVTSACLNAAAQKGAFCFARLGLAAVEATDCHPYVPGSNAGRRLVQKTLKVDVHDICKVDSTAPRSDKLDGVHLVRREAQSVRWEGQWVGWEGRWVIGWRTPAWLATGATSASTSTKARPLAS